MRQSLARSGPSVTFAGVKLSNKTDRSSVDLDALLYLKSSTHPALPGYRGHVPMDNHRALIVDSRVTQAVGTGERVQPRLWQLKCPVPPRKTWLPSRTLTPRQ